MRLLVIRDLLDVLIKRSIESRFCKGGFREVLQAGAVERVFEVLEREGTA